MLWLRIVVLTVAAMQLGSDIAASEPPLVRTSKTSFPIPFSLSDSDAGRVAHIELIFSPNKGKQWFSYAKLATNASASQRGEFSFTAPPPADGEYWFAFRIHLITGEIRQPQPLAPQLRVLIETTPAPPVPEVESTASRRRTSKPDAIDPLGGAPLTPPKRLPTPSVTPNNASHDVAPKALPTTTASTESALTKPLTEAASNAVSDIVTGSTSSLPLLIPAAPTAFDPLPPEPPKALEVQTDLGLSDEAIAELIADMMPLAHATSRPVTETTVSDNTVSENTASAATTKTTLAEVAASGSVAPGRITGVTLANGQDNPALETGSVTGTSKIVVRWSIPEDREVAAAYRVDVLKGKTADGPWQPLVIHYLNGGEYWWHLSHEDFDPFFLAIRTRNRDNVEVAFDKTRSPIAIAPSMLSPASRASETPPLSRR